MTWSWVAWLVVLLPLQLRTSFSYHGKRGQGKRGRPPTIRFAHHSLCPARSGWPTTPVKDWMFLFACLAMWCVVVKSLPERQEPVPCVHLRVPVYISTVWKFVCLFVLLFSFQAIVEGPVSQWLLHPFFCHFPYSIMMRVCFPSVFVAFLVFHSHCRLLVAELVLVRNCQDDIATLIFDFLFEQLLPGR